MEELRTVRIGGLGRVVTGKTPPSARPELFGELYPFLTPTDIDGIARYIEPERFLSPEGREYQHRLMLPERSVCVVCIGATIGKVCMTSRPSFTNQQINSVVVNEQEHDPFFVYHLMTTIRERLKANAGGAATPIINKTAFSGIEVRVPLLPMQRQVAAILSAYDALIENNTRRIQVLERMAQALYREWFVNFRFPGHANVKFVASRVGKIPQGWTPGALGDIAAEVRRGVNPDEIEPETPYIGLEHIPRKSIALSEWGTAKEVQSTKLAFKKGEILFGKIRPYFHKVGVAVVDGVCSTDAIVIVPKKPEHFALVLACVSSEPFVSHATQTSQGTKMPRANWDVLTKYPLPVPPAKLLSLFSESVNDAVGLIENFVFKNRNLRRTRDLLLPKLISGALDVSKLEIETA